MTFSEVAIEVPRIPCIPSLLVAFSSCLLGRPLPPHCVIPRVDATTGKRNEKVRSRGRFTLNSGVHIEGCFHRFSEVNLRSCWWEGRFQMKWCVRKRQSSWCFPIFFIFTPIWGRFPFWRASFSKGLKPPTSNHLFFWSFWSLFVGWNPK